MEPGAPACGEVTLLQRGQRLLGPRVSSRVVIPQRNGGIGFSASFRRSDEYGTHADPPTSFRDDKRGGMTSGGLTHDIRRGQGLSFAETVIQFRPR